jgi:hypothetical protein
METLTLAGPKKTKSKAAADEMVILSIKCRREWREY